MKRTKYEEESSQNGAELRTRSDKGSKKSYAKNPRTRGSQKATQLSGYKTRVDTAYKWNVAVGNSLPLGRPFPMLEDFTNWGVGETTPGVDAEMNYSRALMARPCLGVHYHLAGDPTLPPEMTSWLNDAAFYIMGLLRAEVKSNTAYDINDVKMLLINSMSLYTYVKHAVLKVQSQGLVDPRNPHLWSLYGLDMINVPVDASTYYVRQNLAGDGGLATELQTAHLPELWAQLNRLSFALANIPVPNSFKSYIDTIFGAVYVDDADDGQYYVFDIHPGSLVRFVRDKDYILTGSYGSLDYYVPLGNASSDLESAIRDLDALTSNLPTYFGGSPQMSALVADVMRIGLMSSAFIPMPASWHVSPEVRHDRNVLDMMLNATTFNPMGFTQTALVTAGLDGAVALAAELPPSMGELRIDGRGDFSDPAYVAMITSLIRVPSDPTNNTQLYGVTPLQYTGTILLFGTRGGHTTRINQQIMMQFVPAMLDAIDSLNLSSVPSTGLVPYNFANTVMNFGRSMATIENLPAIHAFAVSTQLGYSTYPGVMYRCYKNVKYGTRTPFVVLNEIIRNSWFSLLT